MIVRKTYGWHKKTDWVSLSQIVDGTWIAKPNVSRTVRSLVKRNIIVRPDNKHVGLQENHFEWLDKKLSQYWVKQARINIKKRMSR